LIGYSAYFAVQYALSGLEIGLDRPSALQDEAVCC
jgi:hypothetical protein